MNTRCQFIAAVAAAWFLAPFSVSAQTLDFDVLIDSDRSPASGCPVTPSGGATLNGFEHRVRATVDLDTSEVIALERASCAGAAFGAPVAISGVPVPYPLALNTGIGGADAVELAVARGALGGSNLSQLRLTFVTDNGSGSDVLATTDGSAGGGPIVLGLPVQIPALSIWGLGALVLVLLTLAWLAHRRMGRVGAVMAVMLVTTAAWAMNFVVDGDLSDWTGRTPNATDPSGDATDGSAATDLVAGFVVLDDSELFFRMDVVDTENQPPAAADDAFDTDEDTVLNVAAPGVLGNDSDGDGDPLTAALDSGPANAQAFTLNADGSFDYTPNPDFDGSDSFTYFANDGQADSAAATVTITVNPINDPPLVAADSVTTDEDAPVGIDVLANDSDVDGNLDPSSVSIAVAPTNGLTSINPATGVITYTKSADFNGSDSLDYEVCDDGTPLPAECATATVSITVESVNDAPGFTAGADVTVDEDAGAQSIAGWATGISAGPPDESGQVLTFNITGNTNPGLFGAGPAVNAAGDLSFTPAADANGSATITLNLSDDGGTANGGVDTSPSQSFTITVDPVNDAPGFTAGADQTVVEDAGPQTVAGWATGISAGPADETGQVLTFNITGNTNPGLFAAGPVINAAGDLSYTPADDANGSATITLNLSDDGGTASGGVDTSPAQNFTINVDPVNDAPGFTAGADVAVDEDAGAQSVAGWATGISAGPPDESGQVLTFNITGNTNPGLFGAGPAVNAAGDLSFTPAADASGSATITLNLSDDGGTANGGVDTALAQSFTITVDPVNDAPGFTAGADPSVLEDAGPQTVAGWATGIDAGAADESGQVLTFNIVGNDNTGLFSAGPALDPVSGNLTFTPAADANGSANIMVELMDDGGTANGGVDTSPTQTFAINVTAVNDPPGFTAAADPAAVNEDSGAQSLAWASAISAGPANEAGQALNFNLNQTSTDSTLSFTTPPSVNTATGNVEYEAAADAYGTVSFNVTLMDNGGTANGGVDSVGPVVLNITINAVNDPPTVSAAPSMAATTNIALDVPAASGLLANASEDPTEAADPNGPAAPGTTLTVGNGGNPPPTTSAMGGDVSINPATGAFTYNPPPGLDSGADSFDFVVCDNGIPGPGACSAPVTATINLSGNTVWFVDNNAASAGDGRLTTPFDSLAAFNAQQGNGGTGDPAAGDFVFLASSATAYSDGANGITLLNDQTLFGQGTTGATFDAFTGIAPPASSAPRPALGGTRPVLTSTNHGVSLNTGAANSNTLRGLNVGNTTNNGLNGVVAGTLNVSEVDITGNGALMNLDGGGTGVLNATFGALNSTNSPAPFAFNVIDFDSGSLNAASTEVTTPAGGAFQMNNNSTTAFDFGDLASILTTNGAGFIVNGAASVTISPPAPVNVQTVGGPALDLANSTFNGFNFSNVSADNTVTGVRLNNVSGVISSGGGNIQNTTGDAFVITGGSSNVTYGGTITNTAGRSVVVTGHSGGNVIFNPISDSGQGIFLDNNTGTSLSFNGTLTLNTGTSNAFTATNGGTVESVGTVGGAGPITTTTGTAVRIDGVTIGTAGFAVESVSSNGAPNGIVLNNTGTQGFFLVSGDGTLARNGSGGTIQNTTNDGVFLNNANNVVLQQMNILNVGNTANPADIANTSNDHAVESRGGGNITLSAVHIQDPIGTGWEAFDITGANSIDNNSLVEELDRTSNFNGLRVTNTNVNFGSVNIINSTFDHADPTPGDAANNGNAMVVVSTRGTAGGTFNVDGSTFTGARGTAITVNSGDAAGSSGTLTSNIMNSTFEVSHPINGQNNIGMQAIQATTHNKLADGNTLRDVGRGGSLSGQIIMQKSDTAIMDAEANGNVISEVVAQHGLDALSLSTSTGGRVDWEADTNTIFNVGRRGIFNSARGNEPDMDVAMRNNTVGRDTGGAVDPVGFDSTVQRGVEIDVQTGAFLQGSVTNNEVIANTSGSSTGGLASAVMFVNVEEFPSGTAVAHVTFDTNTFTNQNGTGSPNILARTRDDGLTHALDFNATTANGMSSTVLLEEASLSTVTVEDLASVAADNPGVSTFNIGAGITDHGGNVPEPDF